jgi:hypothetical protein
MPVGGINEKQAKQRAAGQQRIHLPAQQRHRQGRLRRPKNIRNAEALLKPILGIPPGDFAGMRVVQPILFRRWRKDKEGILDLR